MTNAVTNILKLSSKHFVSNIDITMLYVLMVGLDSSRRTFQHGFEHLELANMEHLDVQRKAVIQTVLRDKHKNFI